MTSTTPEAAGETTPADSNDETPKPRSWKSLGAFLGLLALDVTGTAILFTAWIPRISKWEGATSKYHIPSSVIDLAILTAARLFLSLLALAISYGQANIRPEFTFDMHHKNGVKKSRSELEEEALEQSFVAWLARYVVRPAFPCEFVALLTGLLCITKSLLRLDLEIGRLADAEPVHPLMWMAILFAAIVSTLEMFYVDSICVMMGKWGNEDSQTERPTFLRHLSSTLSLPLLANDALNHEDEEVASPESRGEGVDTPATEEDPTGVSEISKDTNYKASWKDLLAICTPDLHLLVVAFIFLILAAAAQVYIPRYTGKILNGLVETFSGDDDDGSHKSISDVPGFKANVRELIVWSVLSGVFSGIRGSVFSVVGGRVNVRLRRRLMDALLIQDIGFFDTTKTGDITSRLSSDTTLVGDQVTYNVNIFLRSLVQAIGVLIFMFAISWQLSILAFISVPAITVLSKWYGQFLRSLSKVMQTKLAEGNAISEAAMSSMPTVRAFDAATTEFDEFDKSMKKYLALNTKSAVAYAGYATCSTSLPQLVTALVVFYGGLMVRNGDLESGDLVSFLLYLQSLSDAFSYIGYIFSSLTQAVGAADKVFELMNRKPQLRSPDTNNQTTAAVNGTLAGTASAPTTTALWHAPKHQTTTIRVTGLEPPTCQGDIVLKDVEMYYPSRPQRLVLNGLSLHIPPGKVAALVGQSGGGKSSVISLVQHLYEPSSGYVQLDGINVHDLSPRWLSQHISIVSQEPTLFARSIKRNIMYGLEGTDMEPSQEEIERVAKLANADSFIESMPQKYETEVGERGVQLSGGQKQRIAIARALVRKPKVLLLDEATSALDAESEAMVQEAIDHMLQAGRDEPTRENAGMTVMVVAHRLSTIRNADIIFVFQDGKVVEQGHHTELIKNENGPYASLIRRQMNIQQKLEAGKS
eukprot:Nitzschia sp. Nitz4//scaffold22_size323478//235391//238471//NITZ4_000566-RA/size323478-augustus-gene-0.243-mRNA-1//-1//CDS//3329543112//3694//frame0